MEQYYKELLRFLGRKLGDANDAADVAQEAYARVLDRNADCVIAQPRAFLFRAALNLCSDLYRSRRGIQALSLDAEAEAVRCEAPLQEEQLYRRQQLTRLERALDELPSACRRAFLMRQVDGMSHGEIARKLDISTDMVNKHLTRALRHCRTRMRAWEHDAGV
ncbi:sigma-70 family RNA polymerase sigma factor [Achromobacter sp. SD115]|uniref:sigma-70 family RNA polymerase sigma factor n=1 Tax=Achromobacter sp. SD115 TaxID=2782011 RepID=UPI001A97AAF5|nr:sigma-70 family RNA polymerase sigma factor [Achromobacter sp. SD115]MBO1016501.1 sigma-70 family RNA polymerase sigma factor [Achromobacter sp. SD115]